MNFYPVLYHLLFDMNEGPGTNAKTAYPCHGNKFQKSKKSCISQMFLSITFQSKHILHRQVQSAHRGSGNSNNCEELQYEKAVLPVGWIQWNGPCSG